MNATVQNPFAAPAPVEANNASAVALGQREVAEIQAAMIIAKKFPRDPRVSMDRILNACTRPSLADQAVYQYARGGSDISGPSIRLAEELARGWGNIHSGITELSRGHGESECLAYCWDLESNYRDEKRFHVKHWRDTKNGGYALKDERDIYEVIANQGARRKRACILAVIPGDVVEAAVHQCDVTLKSNIEVTPERIASMVEKFAAYGVTKELIEKRIQRHLDAITPALFVNLGKVYNSLRDGMSAPSEWFDVPAKQNGAGHSTSLSEITGGAKQQEPEAQKSETKEQPDAPVAAEIERKIAEAKNEDTVMEAMDLIRELPEAERAPLKKAAVAKMQGFVG